MLKWTSGAKPGKRPPSEETLASISDVKKKYEEKRTPRTFKEAWKVGRNWLKDTPDGMICLLFQVDF